MIDFSEKISEKYSQLRRIAIDNANYYNELAEKNINYLNNENKLKNILLELSKVEYVGDLTKKSALIKQKNELLTKKSKLLNILKINEEKLTPKYSCEKCNDTGIINKKVCECYKKIYSILFIEYFNIDINSFYNFNQAKIFDFNKKYFCEFQKYCDNFPNNKIKTLTFLGNTGTGKTFLAQCIASELINRNYNVIYISSFNLINILKEYHYSFSLNTKELLNVLIDCDMLIIDDLGSEPLEKNVTIEYILNILNERQFSNKHTLYTTNLNNAEIIDRYNERFFDRLNDKNTSKSIMLHNNNFRLKNN